jgi:integrin beta 8
LLQRVPGGSGITLDSLLIEEEGGEVEMEVRHAVQGWILDPRLNLGLELEGDVEVGRATLHINTKEVAGTFSLSTREKRETAAATECTSKCCSRPMKVNIRKLEGFSFIFQPEEFDASHCRGRCPPRYHPLNDHSLLQSLLPLQSSRDSSGRPSIRRPCCAPSKYSNIDILHLDQNDPTRLKVTNWRDIIVAGCACA